MHYYYRDYGGNGDVFSLIYLVLMLVLIVIGAIITVHYLRRDIGSPSPPRNDDAVEVLKKRYAKGEVDKKEFHEKKKELGK